VDPTFRSWWGKNKTHLYVWFLFEVTTAGPRAKMMENYKLKRLFDALEYKDTKRNVLRAQSPVVLITDAQGFHNILCHLKIHQEEIKVKV